MTPEERHKMLQDSVKENAALRAEVSRYRGMIEYARAAPDFSSCKSILADALDGVNGAENYEEVKGEREILRARIALLEKVAEKACNVIGDHDERVDMYGQMELQVHRKLVMDQLRAAIDAAKEG